MSNINIQSTAEELGHEPDIIKMLVDVANENGHTVAEVHAYQSSIGLVELEEKISYNDGTYADYALISPSGCIFPFETNDIPTLSGMCETSGLIPFA